jgi:serine/threonine protein kinase
LLYHWRVLPGSPAGVGVFDEFGDLDGAVAHWENSPAVRTRLEAIRDSTASLVLFLEYIPQTLGAWLSDQDLSAFGRIDEQLADTVAFMRERGLVHFDAHFNNILTDGRRLYVSDFGLALSSRFELSDQEAHFLSEHWNYDRHYTTAHLINYHLAERVRGDQVRRRFVRDWAEGKRTDNVPATAASILTKHACTAVVMDDFHRRLFEESKQVPYPKTQFEHCAHSNSTVRLRTQRADVGKHRW